MNHQIADTRKPPPIGIALSRRRLLRDIRGFAVKFYTEEGNWDN